MKTRQSTKQPGAKRPGTPKSTTLTVKLTRGSFRKPSAEELRKVALREKIHMFETLLPHAEGLVAQTKRSCDGYGVGVKLAHDAVLAAELKATEEGYGLLRETVAGFYAEIKRGREAREAKRAVSRLSA
jgi:hypothetical protein